MSDDSAECEVELDDYDEDYEQQEQDKEIWIGDGHFLDQSWVNLGEKEPVQPFDIHQAFLLTTCLRHPSDHSLAGQSFAHDRHPFVVFLHLLDKAVANSVVLMSIPYLSDFQAIDQLCHYANPAYGGLTINIILGPKTTNIACLEKFVGRSEAREEALRRIHFKRFGRDDASQTSGFSHSKAMVTTAGGMVGSYNFTNKAKKRHHETGVFLPQDFGDLNGLRGELQHLWDSISYPEISIQRAPAPTTYAPPDPGQVHNPYKYRRTI